MNLGSSTIAVPVRTSQTFFYLTFSQVQVIEDLQPALDLASLLTSFNAVSPRPDCSTIGSALGAWLHAFHDWAEESAQGELRRTVGENGTSRDLKLRTTYATIVDIASTFSAIKEEDLEVLRRSASGLNMSMRKQCKAVSMETKDHMNSYTVISGLGSM